jgi:hypothetical protein
MYREVSSYPIVNTLYYEDQPINAVYSENHMKHVNTPCGRNAEFLKVT